MAKLKAYDYFLDLARSRRTTYEFDHRSVKDPDLRRILEAGRWAPSCNNSQPWHFVVVRDKGSIKRLMMTVNYGDFHTDPSVIVALVLICGVGGKNHSCWRGKDSGTHDSYISVGMAGLNMALEARELGIDSCLLTPSQETARKLLKVGKADFVPLLVGLGYQCREAFQKRRVRNELSGIISYEFFGGKR